MTRDEFLAICDNDSGAHVVIRLKDGKMGLCNHFPPDHILVDVYGNGPHSEETRRISYENIDRFGRGVQEIDQPLPSQIEPLKAEIAEAERHLTEMCKLHPIEPQRDADGDIEYYEDGSQIDAPEHPHRREARRLLDAARERLFIEECRLDRMAGHSLLAAKYPDFTMDEDFGHHAVDTFNGPFMVRGQRTCSVSVKDLAKGHLIEARGPTFQVAIDRIETEPDRILPLGR